MNCDVSSLRRKIAKGAAYLLYSNVEKEYKQAKLKAAEIFGVRFLPTNLEVAIELDKIAEENEGPARRERLIHMRKKALRLMKILDEYDPVLIGSVWRGTIHRESDIDIIAYHAEPNDILQKIKNRGFKVVWTEWITVTKKGLKKTSFHIFLELSTEEKAEIAVRERKDTNQKEECEIYGDLVRGLTIEELEKVLDEDPRQRFVPF